MIKNPAELEKQLGAFLEKNYTDWSFGNSILYKMCDENPLHDNADVIVGKVWLIGRSYAAAIERRKDGDGFEGDFYHDIVATEMLKKGKELDSQIQQLWKEQSVTADNLPAMLRTHKYLMDTFTEISGMAKRSLASKYLHFHCPHMFYIYDSRANAKAKSIIRMDLQDARKLDARDSDKEYAHFCVRMLELQTFAFKKFNRVLTPRELDNFLLYA